MSKNNIRPIDSSRGAHRKNYNVGAFLYFPRISPKDWLLSYIWDRLWGDIGSYHIEDSYYHGMPPCPSFSAQPLHYPDTLCTWKMEERNSFQLSSGESHLKTKGECKNQQALGFDDKSETATCWIASQHIQVFAQWDLKSLSAFVHPCRSWTSEWSSRTPSSPSSGSLQHPPAQMWEGTLLESFKRPRNTSPQNPKPQPSFKAY